MSNAVAVAQTSAQSSANATSYTTAVALGPAQSSRGIVAAINAGIGSGTPTISSVKIHVPTVGADPTGTALAVISNGATSASLAASGRISALYGVLLPAGESGELVVTFGATMEQCGVAVWACYNMDDLQAVDVQVRTVISASVDFPALATSDNGFAIFTVGGRTQLSTYTWSNPTERYDATVESPTSHSGADMETSGASVSETATASNASTLSTGVCASWAPATGGGAGGAAQLVNSEALVG